MKKIRFPALIGSLALLAGCMQSNSPIGDKNEPDAAPAAVKGPVLRDPDNNPILEVPVDLLQDIRRQMLEKGLSEDIQELEAAYDFKSGKLRPTTQSTAQ
jgi:hypothetical protein